MTELIELKKTEETKTESAPQIVLGKVPGYFDPIRDKAWGIVKPYVEAIANKTNGEYTAYDVQLSIMARGSNLYMGYIDREGKSKNRDSQDLFVDFITKGEGNFFGYAVVRFDPASVHIWQAYVKEEFQNTNVMEEAFKSIEKEMKGLSVRYITFSSQRAGWGKVCEKLGFEEIYTIYRKKIEG